MSDSFVKLYASILDSSLWWGEDVATRLVWVTLLVAADHNGVYSGTLPGLAGKARVTLEEARHAVWRLQQPDEESRTPDHDGRRIEHLAGVGYQLLNYQKYRDRRSPRQIADAARKAAGRVRTAADMSECPPQILDPRSEILDSRSESERDPDARAKGSKNQTSEPEPEPRQTNAPPLSAKAPPRAPMPHERAEARKAKETQPEVTGAQPALRYKFREDWKPSKAHRARGQEMGLTDDEILERADDCLLKVIKQGFADEDKHFMRELGWAKRDKEVRIGKEQAYANRKDFETPGHRRARE